MIIRHFRRSQQDVTSLTSDRMKVAESNTLYQDRLFNLKADIGIVTQIPSWSNNNLKPQFFDPIFLIKRLFPDVTEIKAIKNTHVIHRLFQVRIGDKRLIIKFNISTYKAWHFVQEQYLHSLLSLRKIHTPPVIDVDISHSKIPYDYIILKVVKGNTLTRLFHNRIDLSNFRKQLVNTLVSIHSFGGNGYGNLDLSSVIIKNKELKGLFRSWREYLLLNLELHLRHCVLKKVLTLKQMQEIDVLLRRAITLCCFKHPVLLHGDLSPQNLIMQQQLLYLLDWEDAILGDPLYDLANWKSFFFARNQDFGQQVLKEYVSQMGTDRDFDLRFWTYYLRIAIYKTVQRLQCKKFGRYYLESINRINIAKNRLTQLI